MQLPVAAACRGGETACQSLGLSKGRAGGGAVLAGVLSGLGSSMIGGP